MRENASTMRNPSRDGRATSRRQLFVPRSRAAYVLADARESAAAAAWAGTCAAPPGALALVRSFIDTRKTPFAKGAGRSAAAVAVTSSVAVSPVRRQAQHRRAEESGSCVQLPPRLLDASPMA